MPINDNNFFNRLNRDSISQTFSQVASEELFNRLRQVSPKMKIEAELSLLSQRQNKSELYQLKLLVHIAANLNFYNNCTSLIKDRYLNELTKLLKYATYLDPNVRLLGLFVMNSLKDPQYNLDYLYEAIISHVRQTTFFLSYEIQLYLSLFQNNPERKAELWEELIRRCKEAPNIGLCESIPDGLITLVPSCNQAQRVALCDLLFEPRLIPIANDAQRAALLSYSLDNLNSDDFLRPRINKYLTTLIPYCNQEQQSLVFNNLLATIDNNENGWLSKEAIGTLITLFPKSGAYIPILFEFIINKLNDNIDTKLKQAIITGLATLFADFKEEQRIIVFEALMTKLNDNDDAICQAAIRSLKDFIPYCNNVQQNTLQNALNSKLDDNFILTGATAVTTLAALVPYRNNAEQCLLLEKLMSTLDSEKWPRYFQNDSKWVLHLHIIPCLKILIPYYYNAQQLTQLLNRFIGLLNNKNDSVRLGAINAITASIPYCHQSLLDNIFIELKKALTEKCSLSTGYAIASGLIILVPYINQSQKECLLDDLIYKLNNFDQHSFSAMDITNCIIALAPYSNSAQAESLCIGLINLSERCKANTLSNITRLFSYFDKDQQTCLFDVLINTLKGEKIGGSIIRDLSNIIAFCTPSQKNILSNVLMNKLKATMRDVLNASVEILTTLMPHLDKAQQTVILKALLNEGIGHRVTVSEVAYDSIVALLPEMNDNQCLAILDLFKNEHKNSSDSAAFINMLTQITLKFIHTNRMELIKRIITLTEEIFSNADSHTKIGLELINHLCNQHLFNHLQNRPIGMG